MFDKKQLLEIQPLLDFNYNSHIYKMKGHLSYLLLSLHHSQLTIGI